MTDLELKINSYKRWNTEDGGWSSVEHTEHLFLGFLISSSPEEEEDCSVLTVRNGRDVLQQMTISMDGWGASGHGYI